MIRPVNDAAAERFLSALERIDHRVERAQAAITSGRKISFASDAPDEIGRLLATRAEVERTVEVVSNLERVKTETDAGEQALQRASQVLDRVTTLGLQGATETVDAEQRRVIGIEVASALEQLVALAATSVQGRYIFSGDSDQAAPYALDPTQPNGVSPYAGSAATRETLHPAGTRLAVGKTAQEIFDDPAAGVFAAVNSLAAALRNEGQAPYQAQTAAIDAALVQLRAAHNHLAGELSDYGTLQNRIGDAIEYGHKLETRRRAELSEIEDADLAAAFLELNQAQTHKEAALAARARTRQTSLFDYLK